MTSILVQLAVHCAIALILVVFQCIAMIHGLVTEAPHRGWYIPLSMITTLVVMTLMMHINSIILRFMG